MAHETKNKTGNDSDQSDQTYIEGTPNTPADFEAAIKASGFGRFNILLLVVACPAVMATVLETAVVSYILPSAECDLSLDLLDKGILNAITYCGMIISAIGWGYLADTKGRKNLLIWGFLIDVVCVLCGALSQSVIQLMISKFFGGFVMCGPFAVLMSYLAEFHGNEHRSRIMMLVGTMFSIGTITLPVLALLILPQNWDFHIFNMNFTSWKMYLAICGIPSLFSGIMLNCFPESPKFLMSQGRNKEAMEAFQRIYAMNTGMPKDTYPIKELINENSSKDTVNQDGISVSTIEIAVIQIPEKIEPNKNKDSKAAKPKKPNTFSVLCVKPYLGLCFHVCLLNVFILLGQNTMRLWLPQLFASIHEYEKLSSESTTMCKILEYTVNKTELVKNPIDECVVIITPSTYSNNLIVACVGFVTYLIAGTLINALGNKRIQVIGLTVAGTCGFALYWSTSSLMTLFITSLYVAMGSMTATTTISSSVNLFPTSLRTMIVSLAMMFGRMGSIVGNVLFPIFMSFGCIPPFVMVGSVMYLACLLSAFLPNSSNVNLK